MSNNINVNWSRWIQQSLIIHYKDALKPYYLHVEGRQLPNPDPIPRFELRVDGPNFLELAGCWQVDITVDILVVSTRSNTDAFLHDRLNGLCASSMVNAIAIKQYGTCDVADSEETLDCLTRSSRIIITNLTVAEPTDRLLFSTVDCSYKVILK